MRALFIDLASHDGLLACVTQERVIAFAPVDHRLSDADLIPLFEGTLSAAGWTPGDITQIACLTGPGGFTSLKVAVTFANTLAHALGIPRAGIHQKDLWAARGEADFWVHSTKRDMLFAASLNGSGPWPEPTMLSVDEMLICVPTGMHYVGELIAIQEERLAAAGIRRAEVRPTTTVLPGLLAALPSENALLEPWYGREW